MPKALHIRLSRDDSDLQIIAENYKITKVVRSVIRAYLQNKPYSIGLPAINFADANFSNRVIAIQLNDKKDADIIEFLRTIPTGRANAIFKALLRNAISKESVLSCISSANEEQKLTPAYKALVRHFVMNMDMERLLNSGSWTEESISSAIAKSMGKNDIQEILLQKPFASGKTDANSGKAVEASSAPPPAPASSQSFGNSLDTEDLEAFDF